ncbi:MAG TPA: T9SS type A sorting domain-containing protein [Chitinophagaceae bacterium]
MKANFYTLAFACLLFASPTFAYTDTVRTGSFIINMGVSPQTINNGLKPYGLVYELMNTHRVPVWWVINTSKTKDGSDFAHNGITYRGGTFVIPAAYRSAAVNTTIANWQSQGVVGATAVSDFLAPVYMILKFTPRWTLDTLNGELALGYFRNAGIPSSAHGGDSSQGWKSPAQLGACDDIFVLPHADPEWSTHNNLYYWNQTHKGNIWASCHAPSVIENMVSPDSSVRLNFLTTDGMVPHKKHTRNITGPFTYSAHGDPIMQFISIMDGALTNGSEQAYLPKLTSTWRSSTTVAVHDASHPDVPSLSNGLAANLAFGRAFGDADRGFVMYQAGHDMLTDGSVAEQVAAQRAFFNYSFFIMTKTYDFEVTMTGVPELSLVNQSYPLTFSVPPGVDLNQYTIKWTASSPGSFSPDDQSQNVFFTPTGSAGQNVVITVSLTDACGRAYTSASSTYTTGVLADADVKLSAVLRSQDAAELSWSVDSRDVSHCELQKQVNNNFEQVAMIFTEESSGNRIYKYTDRKLQSSVNYYRLKVFSKSGTFTYSNIAKVSLNKDGIQVTLMGNPVRNTIRISYESKLKERVDIRLIDMQGRLVMNSQVSSENKLISLDLPSNVSRGQYALQVISSGQSHSFKVFVQ